MKTRRSEVLRLDGEWAFRGFLGEEWRMRRAHGEDLADTRFWAAGRVPGSVLDDAWRAGLVADPYRDRNSLLGEWVGERAWVYRRKFAAPARAPRAELRFESLDPSATVFLNGEELGWRAGPFVPARFDVGDRLRWGAENLVAIVLDPAPREQPQVGRTSLVRHHRPRMTEGWDFMPRLPHQGIAGTVTLWTGGAACIRDLFIRAAGDEVEYALSVDGEAEARVELGGRAVPGPAGRVEIPGLERWWPNGSGGQVLHSARARCFAEGWEEEVEVRFGVRSLRLVPNPGGPAGARPYTFEVNGRRLWIRALNWVPLDALYGVPRPERLARLLELARRAGVNLLRVWGGGLIERDAFYEHCDRLGILVWQEFSQSSSLLDNRPSADPEFVEMLEAEARAIVPRLRNHPSLALWCGGNELSDTGGRPLDESEPALAALGAVVRELDPDRLFLPTSPSGPEFGNTLELIRTAPDSMHDVHGPWEHQGLEGQHTLWNAATSLLNSEFACEGMPNLWTFRRYVTEELWPATKDNPAWAHRGDWFINEAVVQRCFGGVSGVEELARASQYLQAHGLRVALEANRRRRPRNSGSIVWHFNEPFPAGYSTSIVDYDTHPKPAYYAVARAYVPLLVAATLPATAWTGEREFEAEPWVSSFEGAGEGLLSVRLLGVDGRVLASCEHEVRWPDEGMGSAERVRYAPAAIPEGLFLFDLRLDERAAARYLLVRGPDLGPMLRVPKTVLRARSLASGVVLSNAGATAAIEVRLREPVPAPTALVADSGFTLLPGESRQVDIYWPAGRGVLLAEAWNAETVQIS